MNDVPWLVKDFHALYRAAEAEVSETESPMAIAIAETDLRMLLQRLRPVFDVCEQAIEQAKESVTVHLLSNGFALCGKSGPPGKWEPGHRWVSAHQAEGVGSANCERCRLELVRMDKG